MNKITSTSKEFKNKQNKHSNKTGISPLNKKLSLIGLELDIMKPETLLLNVEPSIEATEIIEQIQAYHSMIHKEMVLLVNIYKLL